MKRQLILLFTILLVLVLPGNDVEGQVTRYSITDLGPGIAQDINNNSQVVGTWYPDPSGGGPKCFYWDSIRGRENIDLPGAFESINDSGEAVSSTRYIWNSTDGEIEEIPIFPRAINNFRHVVGWTGGGPGGGDMAVVWDDTNGIQAIDGGINGNGLDVNDVGKVVGRMSADGQLNGFIWDSSNGLQIIPTLGGNSAEANSINNLGQVAGTSKVSLTSIASHAFIWDKIKSLQDLGTLGYRPPEFDDSVAWGINIIGEVVGRSNSPSSTDNTTGWNGWVAFIWDNTNGMQDLNDLIAPNSGWILGTAYAINDHGQIVGYGGFNGEEHAFLLTPITEYLIIQITDNSSDAGIPRINNRGDIAWGEGHNLLQYESSTQNIVHVSSDGGDDPIQMNNNSDIVWAENEIFLYDATTKTTTQITNDAFEDYLPTLNDNREVVWSGNVNERPLNIFHYDGSTVLALPDSYWPTGTPWINNSGKIVWVGYDDNLIQQIYFFNGSSTTKITNNTFDSQGPRINNNEQIIWYSNIYISPDGQELFLYDGLSTNKLSSGGTANNPFDINNNGDVAWEHHYQAGDPYKIFFYNNSTQNVNQIGLGQQPRISDNFVTWLGPEFKKINVYDGTNIIQISHEGYELSGAHPDINNRGDVVWRAHDGNDYEIFMAIRQDITEDTDGDGIPDDEDACPSSDLSDTVVIDSCDSGVENVLLEGGCTISDLILECADNAKNHGKFVRCVSHLLRDLKKQEIITSKQKRAIRRCAVKRKIPPCYSNDDDDGDDDNKGDD
jgi:probable HAF family extracellular repeat protein